jgi:anti-anti-sigma regulatory factor
MLRVERSSNGEVTLRLSGRMHGENIAQLEELLRSEATGHRIVLDLKDVTLVNDVAVSFLSRCEADGITLRNCPAYIREWITRQQRGS